MKRLALRHISGKQFTCVPGMRLVDVSPLQLPKCPAISLSFEDCAKSGYVLRNNCNESVSVRFQGTESLLPPKAAVVVADGMELKFGSELRLVIHAVDGTFPLGWSQVHSGQTSPVLFSPDAINQYVAKVTSFIDNVVFNNKTNRFQNLNPRASVQPSSWQHEIQTSPLQATEIRQTKRFISSLHANINQNQLVSEISLYSNSKRIRCLCIYFWIVNNIEYDVHALMTNTIRHMPASEIFQIRRGVCMHYACLFDFLSSELGVVSRTVVGHADSGISGSGKSFENSLGHAWNIATVDGKAIIIDSTWGAGHVSNNKFTRRPSNYWFDVPPKLAISTHYPDSQLDQLLDRSLQDHEWLKLLPVNYSSWYDVGFSKDELVNAMTFGRTFAIPMSLPDDFDVDIRTPLFSRYYSNETLRFLCSSPNYVLYLCNGAGPKRTLGTFKLPSGRYSVWIGRNDQRTYWRISEFEVLHSA
jgi:hypothetical protein